MEIQFTKERKVVEQKTKILVAVDGSEESMAVVQYVCQTAPVNGSEIVIFTVMSKVPEVFWDLGKDPLWLPKIDEVRLWEQQQQERIGSFMAEAVAQFKTAGFPIGRVVTRIGAQQKGVARDIVAEARLGYDILAIGRGKSNAVHAMILGGVAGKLVNTRTAPSLWLVGRASHSKKVLVALDSSENSLVAVKHAGRVLSRNKNSLTLFHAVRGISTSGVDMVDCFPESYRKQLLDDAKQTIQPILQKAEEILNEMDISSERITTKVVTGVRSRAEAVLDEAEKGGFGTILVGRKGVSEVADFVMGRVTNKLIQLTNDQALCIVE